MIKQLKKRFIIFTMSAVTALLLFLTIAINGMNFLFLSRQINQNLSTIVDSDERFKNMDNSTRPPLSTPPFDMERMRSSRFFIIKSDLESNIIETNTGHIFIEEDSAKQLFLSVVHSDKTEGRIDGYKYVLKKTDQSITAFFIDTTIEHNNFYRVLLVSSSIATLCWIVLLIIVYLLSNKVIRPVVLSIEKQREFITNASHEMKTPLAIIQSNNETMALIHGENKYNKNIDAQTKRLSALMSNLLMLAKLDENIVLTKEDVNLSLTIMEILDSFRSAIDKKQLKIITQIESNITLKINKDSVHEMLTILFDNAIKYTPERGYIKISLTKDGKHVTIEEENKCSNNHLNDAEKLFERFYRGDDARTQDGLTSGFGIGLSEARSICENFGGTLKAKYTAMDSIKFIAKL